MTAFVCVRATPHTPQWTERLSTRGRGTQGARAHKKPPDPPTGATRTSGRTPNPGREPEGIERMVKAKLLQDAADKPVREVFQVDHFDNGDIFSGWNEELRRTDGVVRVQISDGIPAHDAIRAIRKIAGWMESREYVMAKTWGEAWDVQNRAQINKALAEMSSDEKVRQEAAAALVRERQRAEMEELIPW